MALTQVKTSGIADDAVTLAKQAAGTDGQIITYDASGNPTAVGPGTDGQVLTSTGAGSPPAFEAIPAAGATLSNDANNRVVTADGSGGINGEAGLTCDGTHLSITDGNLVIATAGHGIDFSAVGAGSSVTAEENLLDDYECGTWTPAFTTGTVTAAGYYVKVGNLVHITMHIHTWSDDTSGAPIQMIVRPFAAPRVKTVFSTQMTFFGSSPVVMHLETNNLWYLTYQTPSGGLSNFQHSDIQDKTSCNLWVAGTYTIS